MEGVFLLVLLLQSAGFAWALKHLFDQNRRQTLAILGRASHDREQLVAKLQAGQDELASRLLADAAAVRNELETQFQLSQKAIMESAAQDSARLVMLADSAMAHIKSRSVEEKVKVEAQKKQYDMRLELLRDTMAKEQALAEKKKKNERPEPEWIQDADGNRVDRNQIDWMD